MSVDAWILGVLLGTGRVAAVLALGGAATVLAVVGRGTTAVNVRGGGPVVNVAVHGVNLTVGATDIAVPAAVITTVLKTVGVPSVGATIRVAIPVRVVAMATGPGVAGLLVVLIGPVRPLFMPAAWVVFAVFVPVVVPVVVWVPAVALVGAVVVVFVLIVVRAVVFVPGPITLSVVILMPALTNAPERRTQVSGWSAGSAMRHGHIP
jgi:hypothetical protein